MESLSFWYFSASLTKLTCFNNSFCKETFSFLKDEKTDYLYDDCGGIAIKTEKGIVVFSSCSHSGIDNIIEQSKQITGENRVIAVIGGFHLREINSYTDQVIQYFKDNNVESAYMGHCTSDEVIEYFKEKLDGYTEVKKLFAGAKFEIA